MTPGEARFRLSAARFAILSTVRPDGRPHAVPITFAVTPGGSIVTAVDHKPKTTMALQRLANIAANPRVTVLGHHDDDDWSRLWWARADGLADIIEDGPLRLSAVQLLADRYPQYRQTPPVGPVVTITVERWSGWEADPGKG